MKNKNSKTSKTSMLVLRVDCGSVVAKIAHDGKEERYVRMDYERNSDGSVITGVVETPKETARLRYPSYFKQSTLDVLLPEYVSTENDTVISEKDVATYLDCLGPIEASEGAILMDQDPPYATLGERPDKFAIALIKNTCENVR